MIAGGAVGRGAGHRRLFGGGEGTHEGEDHEGRGLHQGKEFHGWPRLFGSVRVGQGCGRPRGPVGRLGRWGRRRRIKPGTRARKAYRVSHPAPGGGGLPGEEPKGVTANMIERLVQKPDTGAGYSKVKIPRSSVHASRRRILVGNEIGSIKKEFRRQDLGRRSHIRHQPRQLFPRWFDFLNLWGAWAVWARLLWRRREAP